jgi:L-galactose dehydrogenase/L-glyceraldehyde 3-phosphate reductase
MKYRRFGRTGLEVSELGFGGGRSGGILIDADDETRRAAVRRALALGVNWFDTAPQYGDGKSEEALGWLLEEIDETPFVSTKVRVDLGQPDLAGQVERNVDQSLARLRRSSVDLLQIHSPITPEAGARTITPAHVLEPGGVADGMERVRASGRARFLGLTVLGERAATRTVIESGRFDAAQVYYNLIAPSAAFEAMPPAWVGYDAAGIIAACKAQDMAVMAIRIFAASYLATRARTGRESILTPDTEHDTEARNAEAVFAALGDGLGSRAEIAVRFALSNPDVSIALIGLSDVAHMEEAARAAEAGPLPASALDALERLYESNFGES